MNGESNFIFDAKREDENHKEYVYRVIRDNIMTLHLLPGSVLNEAELAKRLDVSRTPVHEAIARLRDERLAVIYPRKASIVSRIHVSNFREGYFLRKTVEPAVIELIEGKLEEKNDEALLNNLNRQRTLVEAKARPEEFLKLDDEFHRLIYRCAGKEITWQMVQSVNGHYDRVRYMDAIMNQADVGSFMDEHMVYYMIIKTGGFTLDQLRNMVEKHLGKIWKNFDRLLETYPECFD